MTHPIHQPTAPAGVNQHHHGPAPVDELADLTPTQHAQLQALVTHAVAIATTHDLDENTSNSGDQQQADRMAVMADPAAVVVLLMLALVALVAIVAMALLGLSLIVA